MRFDRFGHRDDVLFVIAILLPVLMAGARFFESERDLDQIARARPQSTMVAADRRPQADLRIADVSSEAR
jgi:hypothetical protein